MKALPSSRTLFVLGFILLVATNLVVLAGVLANRSGEPEALMTLTERELPLPSRLHKENSGLALRIAWRAPGSGSAEYFERGNPAWLDAAKLKELGFKTEDTAGSTDTGKSSRPALPKEVFIVLENNGAAYREAVQNAESELAKKTAAQAANSGDKKLHDALKRAEDRLQHERITKSRLFAVDAGLDPRILREKYNDRTRFIIAKGVVEPGYVFKNKEKEATGHIKGLSVANLHVPLNQRKVLDTFMAQIQRKDAFQPPRYEVKLAYGSRLEPWIVSIHPLNDTSK